MNTKLGAAEIVRSCARGNDARAWRAFLARFGSRLEIGIRKGFRWAGMSPSSDVLEDLKQDVLIRLLENDKRALRRCRGECEAAIAVYLTRVAERVALDHLRAAGAAKRGRDLIARQSEQGEQVPTVEPMSSRPSPEDCCLAKERRKLLFQECRSRSSPETAMRDLRAFYLAFYEGCSSREIALHLGGGISAGTIDCLLYRMRRRLRRDRLSLPRR